MIGLIESVFETYGYIRDQDWDRWCFRPDDILECPQTSIESCTVEFTPAGEGDPRGRLACAIRVVAMPAPDVHRLCRRCRTPFIINAARQWWFRAHRLHQPWFCQDCQHARRLEGHRHDGALNTAARDRRGRS